jgi:hypothetical protein
MPRRKGKKVTIRHPIDGELYAYDADALDTLRSAYIAGHRDGVIIVNVTLGHSAMLPAGHYPYPIAVVAHKPGRSVRKPHDKVLEGRIRRLHAQGLTHRGISEALAEQGYTLSPNAVKLRLSHLRNGK